MCPNSESNGDRALLCPGASQALEGFRALAVFTNEITTHAHSPKPRPSDQSRRGGVLFKSGSNFFVWQFPNRGFFPRRGISVEELI